MSTRDQRAQPLRIVLLNSIAEWGGGEKWCVEAATVLRARGHEVAIACLRESVLEARALEAGIPVWTADRPIFFSALSLARFLRSQKTEVAIGSTGRDLRMGAVACALSGASLVQRRGIARAIKRNVLNRWLYSRLARVITNADALRDTMLAGVDFVDPARFVVIPNGIDMERVPTGDGPALRSDLGIGDEVPLVAAVGRLAPMKGHADLLAAWPAVRDRVPEAVLVIVGEGELRPTLESQISELALSDSVFLPGFRRELDDVYAACDLLALPSRRDEGANNALLEAMAHGRCAVVSECGGLPELVSDGETGRVVPVGDPDALARALVELLSDRERRDRMGLAARRRVAESYSLERVTDLLEELLFELREDSSR